VRDLYSENLRIKEIEEETKKRKVCSCIGRMNIVKMAYYLEQSADSMQSPSKFQCHFSQK
jgi:hypothetical protein